MKLPHVIIFIFFCFLSLNYTLQKRGGRVDSGLVFPFGGPSVEAEGMSRKEDGKHEDITKIHK